MTEPNKVNESEAERVQEALAARAELLRLAEEQGVSPVTNFDEILAIQIRVIRARAASTTFCDRYGSGARHRRTGVSNSGAGCRHGCPFVPL